MIKLNSKAPDFELEDKDGKKYSLKDFKEEYIVIYFYPKDSTPGCTIEAREFTKNLDEFKKENTIIIGISGGSNESKEEFCEKNDLKHILLTDADFSVSKKYDSFGERTFLGKKFTGIFRNTYLLDKKRNIVKIYENVNPFGHAKNVLNDIKSFKE